MEAWAHCGDAMCPGHRQEKINAVRVETSKTYAESGGPGSVPGVENSHVHFRFKDDADRLCVCGRSREVTETQRRVLQPLSGHSQDGLLKFGPYNPSLHGPGAADERVAALEAQVAALLAAQEKQESSA